MMGAPSMKQEPQILQGREDVSTKTNPHQQLTQNAPEECHKKILLFGRSLPHVILSHSMLSVPGAMGFLIEPEFALGPPRSFMIGTEFAHLRPAYDGSLHMMLPDSAVESPISSEWGEKHPMALKGHIPGNAVIVYGPRDDAEVLTVCSLPKMSHAFATGEL
jgi:hypothetical protein